jgi:hypothetical protein
VTPATPRAGEEDRSVSTETETADQTPWLTPGVGGIGIASLLSDLGHEIPTSLLPSLLTSTLRAPASALGVIEGIADGLALVGLIGVRSAILLSIIPGLLAALGIIYVIRRAPTLTVRGHQPIRLRVRPPATAHQSGSTATPVTRGTRPRRPPRPSPAR